MPESAQTLEASIAAEVAAHEARLVALRAAHANPTPGPLAGAFDVPGPALDAGTLALARIGRTLRPVVAADFLLLKRLDSPLYRQAMAAAADCRSRREEASPGGLVTSPPTTEHDEAEAAEMIYQFTTPVRQCRNLLAQGRQAFREAALAATLDLLTPLETPAAVEAVVRNFVAAFATTLGHQAPTPEGEQRVDFSPASPALAMASAGGSTTRPCSAGNTIGHSTP